MSLCINPLCQKPENPDNILFCQNCGSELLLEGRYRAMRRLGGGGFGVTYEVNEVRSNIPKVLKVLINNQPKAVELFQREAEVLAPLLDLAGFYHPPFDIETEESVEIALEDEGEIVKGRIDVLVLQRQLWLLVIESKNAGFSLITAIPQALTYMLGNPHPERSSFGLVLNGSDFIFLKLTKQDTPQYALSEQLTLLKRENELYKVLSILKKLSQVLIE